MISPAAAVAPGLARQFAGSGPLGFLQQALRTGAERTPPEPAPRQDLVDRTMAILERSLAERLRIPEAPRSVVSPSEVAPTPPGPRQVADNILGFVASRLQEAAESGADSGRLAVMLEQARAGFEQGFREARDELEALGLLTDDTSESIEETADLVRDGFGRLESRFVDGDDDFDGDDDAPAAAIAPAGDVSRATSVFASRSELHSEAISLEVTTRDGDTVRITVEAASGFSEEGFLNTFSGPGGSGFEAGHSRTEFSTSRFQFSVEGELDEDERAALEDLVGQVENLADEFFDGDGRAAFEQALSLGYDSSEISGFSLRLTELDVRQVTRAYQSVEQLGSPQGESRPETLSDGLRNFGQFLKSIREAAESADAFPNPGRLFADLFDAVRALDRRDDDVPETGTLAARRDMLDLIEDFLGLQEAA